jgi:ABC-type sugar transport system ATPase subunit
MSLAHNLALNRLARYRNRLGLVDRTALTADARQRMQAFDIRAASSDVPFGASGGNQRSGPCP